MLLESSILSSSTDSATDLMGHTMICGPLISEFLVTCLYESGIIFKDGKIAFLLRNMKYKKEVSDQTENFLRARESDNGFS